MTYPEFIQELTSRFGEDQGVIMALRAEVGFLRKYMEEHNSPDFAEKQKDMIEDFLARHPKKS